jgi:site-specific recombinase XerD
MYRLPCIVFDTLFETSFAIKRHRDAPLLNERVAYLKDLARQGMSREFLKRTAPYLIGIAGTLRLAERSGEVISFEEIRRAASQWIDGREKFQTGKRKRHMPGRDQKEKFVTCAKGWLRFMGRLQPAPNPAGRFSPMLAEFDGYMLKERGLSAATRRGRVWFLGQFLNRLNPQSDSLGNVTITAIDATLQSFSKERGYSRVALQTGASHLRAFFRYSAARGWCAKGLAHAIQSPRVYSMSSLPSGPTWEDVKRLLVLTEGNRPADVRDRAIIMLLAVYGLRAGEVRQLQLDDFDWKGERLTVRRSKTQRVRIFPLARSVGDAVLRYITEVRPRTHCREVFLTRCAPARALREIYPIVGLRLRRLGVTIPHHGPHALRHACATHLLAEGFSLKQIGDQLGHRDADSTRIYAKVDMVGLRKVGDMCLRGLV